MEKIFGRETYWINAQSHPYLTHLNRTLLKISLTLTRQG